VLSSALFNAYIKSKLNVIQVSKDRQTPTNLGNTFTGSNL